MRGYFFGNFYLSSLQQGLQAAHAVADLFIEYPHANNSAGKLLRDWATNHKTIIILNGGNAETLDALYQELVPIADKAGFPVTIFREDEVSLNNATTCVGIVLPESWYDHDLKAELDTIAYGVAADVGQIPLSPQGELKQILNRYRLAH